MKKIGIMSMQRIVNYGSFLQAYGLKKIIESLGYDVEFVDYHIGEPLFSSEKKQNSFSEKTKSLFRLFGSVRRKAFNVRLKRSYKRSILKYLGISDERNYAYNTIEQLVIGSDEVFNCMQGYPVCYSKELFGDNYAMPVISYAACFGNTTLEDLKRYNVDAEIGALLKKFKAISVRDDNSRKIVKAITGINASLNLDPVLIYDFKENFACRLRPGSFILLYAYSGRLTSEEKRYIKTFAKANNKKIVSIGSYQEIADYNLAINPLEVFAYFRKAAFVITDTFHGSIFSIKTHSNFCTIIRSGGLGNSNKLYDLLRRLKLTDRIACDVEDIEKVLRVPADFMEADGIIKLEKENTIAYLRKNLILE